MIGTRLGSYEIIAKLGEGGMGEVYRARDSRLEREVAIKVLPAAFVADPERLARFEREAKLLAQLNHPNIAQIYGLEASGETRALVMELVEGPTLAERLAGGALPLDECLSVARQIAEALEEAHEKGIVHRDLKPQNVKASIEGKAKVLDFGLARAMEPAGSARSSPPSAADVARSPTLMNSPTLTGAHGTQLGVILGTAAYMSPEQARGGAVDKRADIWAFGVVLWELLTGRRLFEGETVSDTLAAVLRAEIDWTALPTAAPAPIRTLLRRCLERNPKNRLHDIADARLVLDDQSAGRIEEPGTPARARPAAPAPLGRRALPWLAGGLAGFALAAMVFWRAAAPAPAASAAAATIRTLVSAGVSLDPSVSPDGRTLAFSSKRDGEERIWIKDLTSGSESVLVRRRSALPAVSPDGTSVLYMAEVEGQVPDLYRVSLATREERLVARAAVQGDWAPDGKRVVFLRDYDPDASAGGGELVAAGLEDGRERVLHRDPAKRMNEPRWSPDGGRVALVLNSLQAGTDDRVGLVDVESGALRELTLDPRGPLGLKVRGLTWISPRRLALLLLDRSEPVSSSGRVALLDLDEPGLRSLLPIANVGWGLDAAGPASLVVSVGSTDQNLHEARREAGAGWAPPAPATEGPFRDRQPVYSPDGRWLLFTSNRSGNLDIWRRDRATGELQRLTDHDADDWDPALSPAGDRLLFSSNRTGRFQVWLAESDGSSPRQVTDLENAQNPTATADGGWIVFVLQDAGEGRNGIWKIRPDGSEPTLVAAGAFLIPETSPDGGHVAFRGPGGRRIVRLEDRALLDTELADTDRYRWSVENGRTYLWALGFTERGGEIRRFPFDPERGALGPAEVVLSGDAVRTAETLGVARDGSAVTFASLANRRGQLIRIDGLTGLGP
jgi:Tol biopolymer transport system component